MENKFAIAVIIAVVCAAVAGVFGYRYSKASDQNSTLQENSQLKSQLEQLNASQASLQHEYEGLKAENEAMQAKHGTPAKAGVTH
jgi:predicted negative regulator of RcsB-dependent stress response